MSSTMKALLVLASLALTTALDIEINSVECDNNLPVRADITLDCDGSDRCTFGETALVSGTLYYNGLADAGVEGEVAYTTAELSLWTLSYNLFELMEIPFCDESMTANEGYECPADGSYDFGISYTLPSAGKESQSWLASGWSGSGLIQIFSSKDSNATVIGECNLSLSTFVTSSAESGYETPAASIVFGVLAATFLAVALLALYCCCCRKKKTATEDKVMDFRRMTNESATPAYVDAERSMA